jgi:hypothetical protein
MSETPSTKQTEPKDGAAPATPAKKDSTNELPMFDLSEALNFVTQIHEKALEAVPMPKVAEGMGYTNPSSTPFYRRIVAARLFGLASKSGAELTPRARGYLKPDGDDVRSRALQEAVTGIAPYAEEIQRHAGKRMNVAFVANSFAAKFGLTDGCATTCAKVFEASLRTAGLLALDGTIGTQPAAKPATTTAASEVESQAATTASQGATRTHVLPLSGNRSVSVTAPLNISRKEIDRVKRWLDVTLLIEEDEPSASTPEAATKQ